MLVPCPTPFRSKKTRALGIPTIDLSMERSELSELIVNSCKEFGFFKLVNHGVPKDIIARMEGEGAEFFGRPAVEKQRAGPPSPFGYGRKNIGFNGDKGELEYLLLQADPISISHSSKSISADPKKFCCVVDEYLQAVGDLACKILELAAEGLWVRDKTVFSGLLKDCQSDSCFRVNHYSPINNSNIKNWTPNADYHAQSRIGFGEHSDPQILTVMRSNDVPGLQICARDGLWIPISPDPSAFCVFVGDALEVLTNGRFLSVRHRVLANNSPKSRMSMMYFGAPPVNTWITPLPQMVLPHSPSFYRPFTWGEYKKAAYSLRLGDNRLDFFKNHPTTPRISDKTAFF